MGWDGGVGHLWGGTGVGQGVGVRGIGMAGDYDNFVPAHTTAAFNPEGLDEDDLPEWVGDEKANFDYNLDKDQNGRLDEDEIRQWMVPDDATMFDVEARHLFYNADSNKVSLRSGVEEVGLMSEVLGVEGDGDEGHKGGFT